MANPKRNPLKSAPAMLKESKSLSPDIALKELFDLLEIYAPAWYTQEQHDRAAAALLPTSKYRFRQVEAPQQTTIP